MKNNKLPIIVLFLIVLLPTSYALVIEFISVTTFEDYALVEWSTDVDANSEIEYGTNESLGIFVENDEYLTEHLMNISELEQNTDYFFVVTSCTNESVCESSDMESFSLLGDNPVFNLTITMDELPDKVNTTRYILSGVTEGNVLIRAYIDIDENPDPILITHVDGTSNHAITTDNVTGIFEGIISLNPGFNNITLKGRKQGRISSIDLLVYADVVIPRVSLNPIPEAVRSEMIYISGTVTEEALIEIFSDNNIVYVFNVPMGPFNRSNISIGEVNDGNEEFFNISLRATDDVGNSDTSNTYNIKVDKKAPEIDFITDFNLATHSTILKIEGNTEPYANVKITNIGNFTDIFRFREESAVSLIQMDPTGRILGNEREATADSDGYFSVSVSLFLGFNNFYINVSDKVGNSIGEHESISSIPGSVNWYASQVEGYPTNIYFEDMGPGFDATAFVVLDWVGGLDAPVEADVKNARIDDRSRGDNQLISDVSEIKSYYDSTNKRLYSLLSVKVKPWAGTADELFDHLTDSIPKVDFEKQLIAHFELSVQEKYADGSSTTVKKYDKVAYAVQKPENLAKWLPPEMINATLKNFINPAINILEKAKEYTLYLTGGFLVGCGASIAANYIAALLPDADTEKFKKAMYWTCDRVLCPTVPPMCDEEFKGGGNSWTLEEGKDRIDVVYMNYDNLDPDERRKHRCPNGTKVLIQINKFKKVSNLFGLGNDITETREPEYYCSDNSPTELGQPRGQTFLGCFNKEAPDYDGTKCWLDDSTSKGINPRAGFFSSFKCGCTPAMYGYSANTLKVFEGLEKCMQQAMIGEVASGFCERMLLMYGCDVATDLFKYAFGEVFAEGVGKGDRGAVGGYKERAEEIKSSLVGRYGDSIHETMGLSPEKLVNDACLFAFTGDLQLFEGALEQFIPTVPIAPYALVMASSRQNGYDPFIGQMNVDYNIYVGIVPGGPTEVELKLVCDKSRDGGEYCPAQREEVLVTQNLPRFLDRDDFIDKNILYQANPARFWYNEVVLTLRYSLGNVSDVKTIRQSIKRHDDLAYGCSFSLPYGISCSSISIDPSGFAELMPTMGGVVGTHVSPSDTITYYPDNKFGLLTKIHNNYGEEFYVNIELEEPNGWNESIQYKINPSFAPNGETQFYNFLVGILGNDVGAEGVIYTGDVNIDGNLVTEHEGEGNDAKGVVYLKSNLVDKTQAVKNGQSWCDAATSVDEPNRCVLESSILEVVNANELHRIDIYNDTNETLLISSINIITETRAYSSGNYRLNIDIMRDVSGDGRGDTQIPYDTNSQELMFGFGAENRIPENCNRKPTVDLIEPIGDYLPRGPNQEFMIGANIVDDCNMIESIIVSVEENNNVLCEITKTLTPEDITDSNNNFNDCALTVGSLPDDKSVNEGGTPPYYSFNLNTMDLTVGHTDSSNPKYYDIRFKVIDTSGQENEVTKTFEVGNVTISEISLKQVTEDMKIEKINI
ncbi:hypothetical protein HQ529_06255 [Candidatus Woesearchaeota archaeon]|nr:hypothetical protein [Candidatus Woesearchaeota archaeon]